MSEILIWCKTCKSRGVVIIGMEVQDTTAQPPQVYRKRNVLLCPDCKGHAVVRWGQPKAVDLKTP